MKILSLALAVFSAAHAKAGLPTSHPDRVTHLPGLNAPLPSNWYSGYLDYELEGRQVHTHYVLVEAEDNLSNDKPLIYWSNGGPGASSLFGLLTELGPLLLSDESLNTEDYHATGIPTPLYNPFNWARLGNLLIIDQPAPVGFSYCNDEPDSHSCGGIAWTDELASLNSYRALQTLFDLKFPALQDLPLFLAGESYAGIYIPTLARRVYNDRETNGINLMGFAVGDGCLGTHTSMCGELDPKLDVFRDYWHVLFMAGHHQIPLADFHRLLYVCGFDIPPDFRTVNDQDCNNTLQAIKKELGGYFAYGLYDECTYENGLLLSNNKPRFKGALNDYACGAGPVLELYLNLTTNPTLKDAFHVTGTFFEVDNAGLDFHYTPTEPDLSNFYQEINGKLRVLVYNGDTDPAITSFATANWTSHLGFTETQHWRPWTVDGCQKMGGYVTRYQGDFDFLTIRGAGHMVPTNKPHATYAFMEAFIEQKEYRAFNGSCKGPPEPSPMLSNKHKERVSQLRG